MTTTVTDAVVEAARVFTYDYRSTTLGIAVVLALVVFLMVRESLRAHGTVASRRDAEVLEVVAWPLFAIFSLIVSVRLLELL